MFSRRSRVITTLILISRETFCSFEDGTKLLVEKDSFVVCGVALIVHLVKYSKVDMSGLSIGGCAQVFM